MANSRSTHLLFILARRVKAPLGDMFMFIFLSILDVCAGIVPTIGDLIDAFLRIHSWFGNRLLETINLKLLEISSAKALASNGEYQDLDALRARLLK